MADPSEPSESAIYSEPGVSHRTGKGFVTGKCGERRGQFDPEDAAKWGCRWRVAAALDRLGARPVPRARAVGARGYWGAGPGRAGVRTGRGPPPGGDLRTDPLQRSL